ncbi:UDP-N-acetylmuramate dehydrogenase [Arabiibacter massiliensis]|uniref:UDP-N-acetylmuramate dehydrogenase n=1 Tax=Arabiibacter massiliensis TaxID=1870985 RepID=UPI0038991D67
MMRELLGAVVGAGRVREDEPMAAHTTFRIGGPADFLVEPRTVEEARAVYEACRAAGAPVCTVGLGSDLLVSDAGLRCVVVRIAENLSDVQVEGERLRVQAGASNAQVADVACAAGLAGYEFASGIPGTVGGAAIMNAGAYDGEFKDVCESLLCLTAAGDLVEVGAEEAAWSYRHSMMDEAGHVVLEAVLRLERDDPAAIRARMDDLARRRAEKQPLEMPSAGSTFKRPTGFFVGKLVQDAGLRGFRVGGAQVSEKHTGFVVNAGGATAEDVRALIAHVRARVLEDSGVRLESEVRMWGFDD